MESLLLTLLLGFGVTVPVITQAIERRARRAAMLAAASLLDLKDPVFRGGVLSARTLSGRLGRFNLSITEEARNRKPALGIALSGGRLPRRVELRAEGLSTTLAKAFSGPDIEIGDEEFDARVLVIGNPVLLSALLDAGTRRLVQRFVSEGGVVRDGVVGVLHQDGIGDPQWMAGRVGEARDVAERLSAPVDPLPRLLANATGDPHPRVRLRCLERAVGRFRHREQVRPALLAALGDEDDWVRLLAARSIGEEGRTVLQDLACTPGMPTHIAAGALQALGGALDVGRGVAMLEHCLSEGRLVLARVVVETLGMTGDARAVARLAEILTAGRPDLAAVAARGLGAGRVVAAQPHLMRALGRDEDEVRTAAATALGEIGGPEAVAPLRASFAGRPLERALRRAALEAIDKIQARASGASPGQLSLASAEQGSLSLAEFAERGDVALACDPGERAP